MAPSPSRRAGARPAALEDLVPSAGHFTLPSGLEVQLRRVTGQHAIRFLAVIKRFKDQLGLKAISARDLDLGLKSVMELAGRLLEGLAAEVDLDNPEPQLGPLSRIVYQEIGSLLEPSMTALAVSQLSLDDQMAVVEGVLRQEEGTALGNLMGSTAGGISSFLLDLGTTAKRALIQTGSVPSGSTTTSSNPSEPPTAGPTSTSSVSPLPGSLPSSEPSATGTTESETPTSEP